MSKLRSVLGFLGLAAQDPVRPPTAGEQLVPNTEGSEISGDIEREIGVYNPKQVSLETMYQMRLDPDVAFGTAMVRAPLIKLNWSVESRDEKIKAFVTAVLKKRWRELSKVLSLAILFGYKLAEKVWEAGPYAFEVGSKDGTVDKIRMPAAWTYKRFKAIDGRTLTLLSDPNSGEFMGVRQGTGFDASERRAKPDQVVLWSFRDEDVDGLLTGLGLYWQVYKPWYRKEAYELFESRYFERNSDPLPIGRAPADKIKDENNRDVSGYAFMKRIMFNRRNGASVVLPWVVDEKTGKPKFDMSLLEDSGKTPAAYHVSLGRQSTQILRAHLVPDETGTSQDTGSRARSQTHQDTMLDTFEGFVDEAIEEVANPQVVDPLVLHNFGQEALEESQTRLVPAGISPGLKDTLKEVLKSVMDAEAVLQQGGTIPVRKRIDAVAICQSLKIPLLPEDEVEPDQPEDDGEAGAGGRKPGDPDGPITPEEEAAAQRELERRGALDPDKK